MPLKFWALVLLTMPTLLVADPLNDTLLQGASSAHFQEGASVFGNPAALAFQTELNGPSFSTSLLGSANRSTDGAFALGLALGYLGLGYERLTSAPGNYNRYSFALAAPLHPKLFLGTRLTLTRSSIVSVGSPDSLDVGIQYRPSPNFSVGLQANRLNEPTVGAAPLRTQWVASFILRPLPRLELTADVDTLSGNFGKQFGYQTTAAYSPFDGFQFRIGYHDLYKAQVGLRFDLGQASLTAVTQPSSRERTFVFGLHSNFKPRPSVIAPNRALEVVLDGSIGEEPVEGSLFLSKKPSLWQKLESLDQAAKRHDVGLIILRIEDFHMGLGPATEVFDKVMALRGKGKRVVAFIDNVGIAQYLIASAADRVFLSPGSQLTFTGLSVSHLFLKGPLDKIGIEGEVFARGKYKSAPETFTRKESSTEAKEENFALLKELEKQVVSRLVKSGRVTEKKWAELLKTALVSSGEALSLKLVDGLGDYHGEQNRLKSGYLVSESLDRYEDRLNLPHRIAVIHADGNILRGPNRLLSLGGSAMTPESMSRRFKTALSDPRTAGIVMRISSGGGEVGPSYSIAAILEEAKKTVPVVVSMGSLAASGGYLIAAPSDRIFAADATLTGPIGVFLGKPNMAELFKKIDLHLEILSNAPHAGLMAWDRPLTAEGRQILTRQLNLYYEDFTAYVARHRKLAGDKVEAAAQGRVWTGTQAKALGLVDELGGLAEAVAYLGRETGLGGNPEVREVPTPRGFFDFFELGGLMSAKAGEPFLLELLPQEWKRELPWVASLKDSPFLLLSPIHQVE